MVEKRKLGIIVIFCETNKFRSDVKEHFPESL